MATKNYDFSGWATVNNLRCSDGRTIRKNAFADDDGLEVPLVWQHGHNDPDNVLGHALLENRNEGVYTYCSFNNTKKANTARMLVENRDIKALSIYANGLKQKGGDVLHGSIKEVSLVLSGANPGAVIDVPVIQHSDGSFTEALDEAYIMTGKEIVEYISHDDIKDEEELEMADNRRKYIEHADEDKTIEDVLNEMTEEQLDVLYYIVDQVLADQEEELAQSGIYGGDMRYNIFEQQNGRNQEEELLHSDMDIIFEDAKRYGSLKDSVLAHAGDYGIDNIDFLFPDAKTLGDPTFIKRDTDWVADVINGCHHSPFARVKSIHADITAEEARARGYIKGNKKVDEVFSLLKRETNPQTIYKKQKLDRNDIVDVSDFNVVAWLKAEMRLMLEEELARAVLIGDGRTASSPDKISEYNIRPIVSDDDLYSVKVNITLDPADVADAAKRADAFITAAIKNRKLYKGSGSPVLYASEDIVTDCLLLEDGIGRTLYKDLNELANKLRVARIVTVPVMEGVTRTDTTAGKTYDILGIMVNLKDYNIGADKGGQLSFFDDFDIDYNQQKYLMETRASGALVLPKSALVFEIEQA